MNKPAMLRVACATAAGALLGYPGPGRTGPPPAECVDEACHRAAARRLLEAGRAEDARALLKDALAVLPDARDLAVLLGVAYARQGNHFWAMRSLSRYATAEPPDCEARAWMAWSQLQVGALEAASATLQGPACGGRDALAARASMVRALCAHYAEDRAAADDALAHARAASALFPTDRQALEDLTRRVMPTHLDTVRWDAELHSGYTTNALLEAPTDPSSEGDIASPLLQTDLRLQGVMPPLVPWLRPAAEMQARLLQHTAPEARDLSYGKLSGWVGAYGRSTLPRLRLGYRLELMHLGLLGAEGERTGLYDQAHRAELEVEVAPSLLTLAGFGRRWFVSEPVRDRWEWDVGAGSHARLHERLTLMWALRARQHRVLDSFQRYDLLSARVVASLQVRLVGRAFARVTASAARDRYPHWREPLGNGKARRDDELVKVLAEVLSPPVAGARVSLAYEYADRTSTEAGYSMGAHRMLLRLRWRGSRDLTLPPVADEEPLASFDWGLQADEPAPDERIQDILRQDDQMQNVCGCGG